MTKKTTKKDFKKILAELEDPKNNEGVNYDLPENPTLLQVAKFNICQNILAYQQDNDISDEELAQKINLSIPEAEEILFCKIDKFTLDRLVAYATNLGIFLQVKEISNNSRSIPNNSQRISLSPKSSNGRVRKHA